jgi:hypothetical protein
LWLQHGGYENAPRAQIIVEKSVAQTVTFRAEKGREEANAIKTIHGRVFLEDSGVLKPVSDATVRAVSTDYFSNRADIKTDSKGSFEIRAKEAPLYVEVITSDGKFGKMVVVQPDESESLVLLERTAFIRGTIFDRRSGKPVAGRSVEYTIQIPAGQGGGVQPSFRREVKTDKDGNYLFSNLPTGIECNVSLPMGYYGESESRSSSYIAPNYKLQPGVSHALQDRSFDLRPKGSEEFSFQFSGAHSLSGSISNDPYENRFKILLERAKRDGKGVLAIFVRDNVERESEGGDLNALKSIYETLFWDDDMFAQTERFYMMCIRMQPKEERGNTITVGLAKDFAAARKIDPAALPSLFSFAFFDAEGKLRGVESFDHKTPTERQKQDLIEMLKKY